MSGGIGLKPWEIRQIRGSMGVSLIAMPFAVASAGAAIGLHWAALAYAAGAALAWAALRAGATGGGSRRLRRVLARICEWELRIAALVLMFLAGMQILAEFVLVPLEPLKALWDPEVTKAEIARAISAFVTSGSQSAFRGSSGTSTNSARICMPARNIRTSAAILSSHSHIRARTRRRRRLPPPVAPALNAAQARAAPAAYASAAQ